MSDYVIDGVPASGAAFTARACDPQSSAVVEACAGSGKTWLLVSRLIRLLLAGAAPGEILAITFTRRAAQEMRARLLKDLKQLAEASDAGIVGFLTQRGIPPQEAQTVLGAARGLYERVVTARVPLTIDTFHGWFWTLAASAPLGSGVPFAPTLLEAADRVRHDGWLRFCAALTSGRHAVERAAWEQLVDDLGDWSAESLLMAMLDQRAEWWSFAGDDEAAAIERALTPLRITGVDDVYARVRAPQFIEPLRAALALWCTAARPGKALQQHREAVQRWLDKPYATSVHDFNAICRILLTKDCDVRVDLTPAKLAGQLDFDCYAPLHAQLIDGLFRVLADLRIRRALRVNEAGLICGRLLINQYQALKQRQQMLDFTDLEWHAHRLLADADTAAYMQARLDARYRHLLLDEFQDTNPLQWQVLQSWLAAYGPRDLLDAADARPTVFVVGDPKQSIYRFRRAEPRVFAAASELLRRDFGASQLRTNVTRRNPQALIELLNRVMPGANPLYQAQSTLATSPGAFVLLPLSAADPDAEPSIDLRDVLVAPRAERDADSHYREGRALANEIANRVAATSITADGVQRAASWADVLVLLRGRTHLRDFERAFRDAGVPFVSDRSGGLLATLEAADLDALLHFLTSPTADLKLAHALRSPIFGASDDDLIRLAGAAGSTWWQRLLALADPVSVPLASARALLTRWQELAALLPVHDLLDRIYHEADLRRRYAAVAPSALQEQVQANLDAFIELALALDAGRYPSLPRFIDELARLKQPSDDAPEEGHVATGDAVRLMTIHGAKGLEAEIVALAGAHAREPRERPSVLIVWPPDAPAPAHLSLIEGGRKHRDGARERWFADEDEQCEQEDWNLLYVAATRARQVLIVSGTTPANGEPPNSWYAKLAAASDLAQPPSSEQRLQTPDGARTARDFLPSPRPTGTRAAMEDSVAQRLGRAWHALLEADDSARWPALLRAHALTDEQGARVMAAAQRVREKLPHLFERGDAEVDLMSADGELLRVDRLIEHDGATWVLDFKWSVGDAERPAYEAQVRRYVDVLGEIRPGRPVRSALVLADASFVELPPS